MVWGTPNLWHQMTGVFVFEWEQTVVIGIIIQSSVKSIEVLFK